MEVVTARLAHEPAVFVTVSATQGSAPREPGAWMLVFEGGVAGTIGGGHVEHEAIALARQMLRSAAREPRSHDYQLGPSLGQCCGGAMQLQFEFVAPGGADAVRSRLVRKLAPLALFGGGHVGRAIVHALGPLPFSVTWIDSRDEIFPAAVPANVQCEHSDPVHAAVRPLDAQSRVLVMSFSHAEDLDIVAECLKRMRERDDLPFVGMIGSKTKWATFRHRLEARGFRQEELARVTCPIGIPGIVGKQPEVIAAGAVAQILQLAPP